MNKYFLLKKHSLLAGLILPLVFATSALADARDYQVTGHVMAITDTSITVQKGGERWVILRDPNTKVMGDSKVGAKVLIHYHMVADAITAKSVPKK